jgi:uncharacterized Rmd1/YagE family protein
MKRNEELEPLLKKAADRQPKRTTKTSQKLALFPESQTEHHEAMGAERERWLSTVERKWLPRVTAYCTAGAYKMDSLIDHLRRKNPVHRTAPKRYDEVIYTPFALGTASDIVDFEPIPVVNAFDAQASFNQDQNIDASGKSIPEDVRYDELAKRIAPIGEILYFDYGVIVMWGFSTEEEQLILEDLTQFQEDALPESAVETEQFYFHYNTYYQPRIYNDIITLKVLHLTGFQLISCSKLQSRMPLPSL